MVYFIAKFSPEPLFTNPYLTQELQRWSDNAYLIFCYNPVETDSDGVTMTNEEFRHELLTRRGKALYYEIDVTDPINQFSICPTSVFNPQYGNLYNGAASDQMPAIVYANSGKVTLMAGPLALEELDHVLKHGQ